MVILPVGHIMGGFEAKNNIALVITVCIASLEVIVKLQREKLRQSRAVALKCMNAWTITATEELNNFVALSSPSTQSVISGRHLL